MVKIKITIKLDKILIWMKFHFWWDFKILENLLWLEFDATFLEKLSDRNDRIFVPRNLDLYRTSIIAEKVKEGLVQLIFHI